MFTCITSESGLSWVLVISSSLCGWMEYSFIDLVYDYGLCSNPQLTDLRRIISQNMWQHQTALMPHGERIVANCYRYDCVRRAKKRGSATGHTICIQIAPVWNILGAKNAETIFGNDLYDTFQRIRVALNTTIRVNPLQSWNNYRAWLWFAHLPFGRMRIWAPVFDRFHNFYAVEHFF